MNKSSTIEDRQSKEDLMKKSNILKALNNKLMSRIKTLEDTDVSQRLIIDSWIQKYNLVVQEKNQLQADKSYLKYDNKEVGTFSDDLKVSDNYKGYSDEQIMNHAKSLYEKGSPYSGIKPISTDFKSQHFDQPNILAHLRANDRVDADGKKVLFVEEVQSDWHQTGRQKGYTGDVQAQLGKINEQRQILLDEQRRYEKLAEPYTSQNKDAPSDVIQGWTTVTEQLRTLQTQQNKLGQGVPDAPFKTTWHELSMKRAIQLAAEGGYDRVAFTTGKTQAERYDLSKQIDELLVTKNPNGTFNLEATMPNGGGTRTVGEDITADKLDDIVGKDLANSIRKQESKGDVYSADDLRVGGEGMKKFYDQILPKFLDKYAKKWDAKTGMTKIAGDGSSRAFIAEQQFGVTNTAYSNMNPRQREELLKKVDDYMAVNVQYIDVTPKMKESVLTKGQPLFAIGAGGAAVQQEDNQ